MAFKYYCDSKGNYIGAFGPGAKPPAGSVEVPDGPDHYLDVYDRGTGTWAKYVSPQQRAQAVEDEFKKLPKPVRVQFALLKAAVKSEVEDGDIEVARGIIEGAAVPPELEQTKAKLLSLLDG